MFLYFRVPETFQQRLTHQLLQRQLQVEELYPTATAWVQDILARWVMMATWAIYKRG